jgi:hypothetical protein
MKYPKSIVSWLVAVPLTLVGCIRPASDARLSRDKVDATLRIAAAIDQKSQQCRVAGLDPPATPASDQLAAALGLADCDDEVRERALLDCIGEIQHAPCSQADATRIPTCRAGAICSVIEEGTL